MVAMKPPATAPKSRFPSFSPPRPKRKQLLHFSATVFFFLSLYMAYRQIRLISYVPEPVTQPAFLTATRHQQAKRMLDASEASVNLWRKVETNFEPEENVPDEALYGTGKEVCYSIGRPRGGRVGSTQPARFWQMNSRGMCYVPGGACWFGRSLENLMTFEKRGSAGCKVVEVEKPNLVEAIDAGLNESCARWRERQVISIYGKPVYSEMDKWLAWTHQRVNPDPRHHAVQWESSFAIVVPKYEWSYNICHYNRLWNFIIYVVKNLALFVPDAHQVKTIDLLFRSGYTYDEQWHKGIRNATLPALERETGKKITVRKIRYDSLRDFQCIRRGVILGREARVDAFPFFNDTDVWLPEHQIDDTHWPVIPHDSLWLREVMMQTAGLPSVGKYSGPGINHFESIAVPPKRVGFLQRSERSRRRLSLQGRLWFANMLRGLCREHGMELVEIRASSRQTLVEQVTDVHALGMAVGLHGANIVNSMFIPAGGALFEIFPWRYVRFYYAAGGNAGLRYSFHEPEGGIERNCSFTSRTCFMEYRESLIRLTTADQRKIQERVGAAMKYIVGLHERYPNGQIPLKREGNVYHFDK